MKSMAMKFRNRKVSGLTLIYKPQISGVEFKEAVYFSGQIFRHANERFP
jgi:hypothetical protein